MFITALAAIGARRLGYDWRRDPVRSLGIGAQRWPQRANFGLAGVLTLLASSGLRHCPRGTVGPGQSPHWWQRLLSDSSDRGCTSATRWVGSRR